MPFRTARLIELRKSYELNQHELGEALGLSRGQIQRYENGESSPKDDALIAMAEYFNTSADYLLGLSNVPHPGAEPEPDLPPPQAELLDMVRQQPEPVQRLIVNVVRALLDGLRDVR